MFFPRDIVVCLYSCKTSALLEESLITLLFYKLAKGSRQSTGYLSRCLKCLMFLQLDYLLVVPIICQSFGLYTLLIGI